MTNFGQCSSSSNPSSSKILQKAITDALLVELGQISNIEIDEILKIYENFFGKNSSNSGPGISNFLKLGKILKNEILKILGQKLVEILEFYMVEFCLRESDGDDSETNESSKLLTNLSNQCSKSNLQKSLKNFDEKILLTAGESATKGLENSSSLKNNLLSSISLAFEVARNLPEQKQEEQGQKLLQNLNEILKYLNLAISQVSSIKFSVEKVEVTQKEEEQDLALRMPNKESSSGRTTSFIPRPEKDQSRLFEIPKDEIIDSATFSQVGHDQESLDLSILVENELLRGRSLLKFC